MHSCLYEGRVRHRRFEPKAHAFEYPVAYAFLDLDELDTVFEGRWFWSTGRPAPVRFRREDYLGDPRVPLKTAVRECIRRTIGRAPSGPIRLLTHLRHFGFSFNPVSFYYCFSNEDEELDTIVAEITNTPWNERHAYVLPRESGLPGFEPFHFQFAKVFHVSPFMPMDLQYEWAFGFPDENLTVRMTNRRHDRRIFEAMLALERRPLNAMSCARSLLRYPLTPLKVLGAIYWQALNLYRKGTPFYVHPSKNPTNHIHGGAKQANTR